MMDKQVRYRLAKKGKSYRRLRFGFKGKNQSPLFMVWWEYYSDGEVVYADIIIYQLG